ncbi:MAG: hypothetical protein RR627_08935 [Niameybacter sp.]
MFCKGGGDLGWLFVINLLTNHPNFVIDINDFILNLVGVTLSLIMLKYIEKNEIINIYKKK